MEWWKGKLSLIRGGLNNKKGVRWIIVEHGFIKVAMQHYWSQTSSQVFSYKCVTYLNNSFQAEHLWGDCFYYICMIDLELYSVPKKKNSESFTWLTFFLTQSSCIRLKKGGTIRHGRVLYYSIEFFNFPFACPKNIFFSWF